MQMNLLGLLRAILKNKAVKKALRNAGVVGMYTFFASLLVLDTITLKTILVSLATAGLVFSTELANYYKIKLNGYLQPRSKTRVVQQYEPFFNL